MFGPIGQLAYAVDDRLERLLDVALAAGARVDHRDADLDGRPHRRFHDVAVLAGLLHRLDRQFVLCRQLLDPRGALLPPVDHQVLAHPVDSGNLDAVVPGGLGVLESRLHVVPAEKDGINA